MMPVVTVDDFRDAVSANAFRAGGGEYKADGLVSHPRPLSDGGVIEAKVKGNALCTPRCARRSPSAAWRAPAS